MRAVRGELSRLAKATGLDVEDLKVQVVRGITRQDHLSACTPHQAGLVLDHLRRELAKYPSATRPAPHEPWGERGDQPRDIATISPRQQHVLAGMYAMAGMDTPQKRAAFAMRQCKTPWPQTQQDCDKIYQALGAIILRSVPRAELLRRARAALASDRIDAWQRLTFLPGIIAALEGDEPLRPGAIPKLLEAEARVAGVEIAA